MGCDMVKARLISAACTALLLSGCASATANGFPSLARRDAERVSGTIETPPPVAAPVIDPLSPELSSRLAQLEARAGTGHARFRSRESRARQLVGAARGAAVGSEGWSVATVAVAELEAARSEVMIALAELDSLYAAERVAGSDGVLVGKTRDNITALVEQEDRVIAQLGNALRS